MSILPAAQSSSIVTIDGRTPMIDEDVFVAPGAIVTGEVSLAGGSSVWFGCVLRGDERAIRIGERTNVQDLTVIHTSRGGWDAEIGADVTVGHRAVLHGCRIHDRVLIGIGAIVLDGVEVESGAVIAAGAIVAAGTYVRAGELWAGVPAKKIGVVSERLAEFVRSTPPHYAMRAASYREALDGGVE